MAGRSQRDGTLSGKTVNLAIIPGVAATRTILGSKEQR